MIQETCQVIKKEMGSLFTDPGGKGRLPAPVFAPMFAPMHVSLPALVFAPVPVPGCESSNRLNLGRGGMDGVRRVIR
ncbi:MAG: hypothetical protein GY859_41950 [Desulfobacterales bacterium]|nr:hypothetical protein [Desulfobacterales bacterium]